VLMITVVSPNVYCASLVEAMNAHCRAQLQFPTRLGVKFGVLLFGYGLHHRVDGVLYPRKIIAGILVNGGAL
jgi:hypothetical protein